MYITKVGFKWNEPSGLRHSKLEAAHVKPRIHGGKYSAENILPMRQDIHMLFDRGIFRIKTDNKIKIHPEILKMESMSNFHTYNGSEIIVPENFQISRANKNWHKQHVYGSFITGRQIRSL